MNSISCCFCSLSFSISLSLFLYLRVPSTTVLSIQKTEAERSLSGFALIRLFSFSRSINDAIKCHTAITDNKTLTKARQDTHAPTLPQHFLPLSLSFSSSIPIPYPTQPYTLDLNRLRLREITRKRHVHTGLAAKLHDRDGRHIVPADAIVRPGAQLHNPNYRKKEKNNRKLTLDSHSDNPIPFTHFVCYIERVFLLVIVN